MKIKSYLLMLALAGLVLISPAIAQVVLGPAPFSVASVPQSNVQQALTDLGITNTVTATNMTHIDVIKSTQPGTTNVVYRVFGSYSAQ